MHERMEYDTTGKGRETLKKMPRLIRNHLIIRLLTLLDDYEYQPGNRSEPYLKIGVFDCPAGRFAEKSFKGQPAETYLRRVVIECLLKVGLENEYITSDAKLIPITYKITDKGKQALRERASARSSVIGGVIVEKMRDASRGTCPG